MHGLRGFALDEPHLSVRIGKEEIDSEALLIAEMVELLPRAAVDLALHDLRGNEPFEDRPRKESAPVRRLSVCRADGRLVLNPTCRAWAI
jgi:hypothetical protein